MAVVEVVAVMVQRPRSWAVVRVPGSPVVAEVVSAPGTFSTEKRKWFDEYLKRVSITRGPSPSLWLL